MLNIQNPMGAVKSLRYYVMWLYSTNYISIPCSLPDFHPKVVKYSNWGLLNYDFVTSRYLIQKHIIQGFGLSDFLT